MMKSTIPPALARAGRIYFHVREREAEAWHAFRWVGPDVEERRMLRRAKRLGALARRLHRKRINLAASA